MSFREAQRIAEGFKSSLPWTHRPKSILRHYARRVAFAIPSLRRAFERPTPPPAAMGARWDRELSETVSSTYLGGTITVDMTAAAIATLIRYRAPPRPSIVDIGCGGGELARLFPDSTYIGFDVSRHAIELARRNSNKNSRFQAADLREVSKLDLEPYDVLVFSEVLYYVTVEEALGEVERLATKQLVIVSMKNDGKSHAILAGLEKKLGWIDSILWQQKASPSYRIHISRETPAILVSAFKKSRP
jgi:SAM-dependent methyltransferase